MSEKFTQRLITLRHLPIRYLFIPKCGCTFVKNLMWRLDTGAQYHKPLRIHDVDNQMLRVADLGLTPEQIKSEDFAFTVLRNPVDRFYSLYTDKVVGPGHKMYVPLRAILAQKYGLDVAAKTVSGHTKNCAILIEWLAENLHSERDIAKEAHWTPQTYRKNLMWKFDLKLLIVKDLEEHLTSLLKPIVHDISNVMAGLERNRSIREFRRDQVITPVLRKRINEVFREDRELFELVRDQWKMNTDMNPDAIPRYRSLMMMR